jgi:hypothetical protein
MNVKLLLSELSKLWAAWPAKVEIKVRDSNDPNLSGMLGELEKMVRRAGSSFFAHRVPSYGPGRKDFHDRRIIFHEDPKDPKRRTTVLCTGGIERYVNKECECSFIICGV